MITWILIIIGVLFAGFILFLAFTAWVISEGFKAREEEAMKLIEQQRQMSQTGEQK